MTKLTPEQRATAKAWLHDVFIWGGLVPIANARRPAGYRLMYASTNSGGKADATTICDEIKTRSFKNVNSALDNLSYRRFNTDIHSADNYGNIVRKKPEMLARYIAEFCANNKIYWDDSIRTQYEVDEFKSTTLGKALWDYNCFISQENTPTRTRTTKATQSGTPGQPQNNYKASGAQSAKVRDLKGTAGQKVIISSYNMLRIEGTSSTTKNVPTIFIKPLNKNGEINGTNKIFMGSGNGYTDCTLYFDDSVKADKFMQDCIANNRIPNTITNLHVAKTYTDRNGYYKVGTEFGEAYIKASKLNEELREETEIKEVKKTGGIQNIDVYDEAFHKYE